MSISISAPIHDWRLSCVDAQSLVAAAQKATSFPLTVNDDVLAQLNLLLGTPDGRAFLHAGIARMREHESQVSDALRRYSLPSELEAVPLVESGYRNLPATGREKVGAGLWMFVRTAAFGYGLHVSAERDDRLDIAAETEAAMRMFADLHRHFGNWPLALMAYNTGAARVETGITVTHSRDAWTLDKAGYGNDPHYLARVMAVTLILANPGLLH